MIARGSRWRTVIWWGGVGLILVHVVMVLWALLLANVHSNGGDEGASLLLGLDVRAGAAWSDGNRQPLFPFLIAPWAGLNWRYFTMATITAPSREA